MRVFKHFPENKECLLCKTQEDKECVLAAIDGTEDGNICEAEVVHLECLLERLRYVDAGDFKTFYVKVV